jgi:hypothetical protein
MNIVFAYHNGDAELALLSAKAITSMGINMRHKATVCATKDTALIHEITEELKKTFPDVGRIIAQDGYNGWPLGPNQMFADAAAQCYAANEPWMFWEPDCIPMKMGWVDDLETEFRKEPAILGHKYEGGVATNGKNIYNMIVGSAVYPPKFLDFCPSARSLDTYNMAYRNAENYPEPWDVRCRWNFMAIGRDCPLLRTYWKSVNYQWKDGRIVFFAENSEAEAIQEVTCPDRFISSQAVVIHGCKDGSLHKMAIAGFPMPSDSTGLDIPSNSMGLEGGAQIATPHTQIDADGELAPYPIQVLCEAVGLTTREKRLRAVRKNPPKKAKKKRVISEAERERRRQSMMEILQRKRERKAQGVV